MSSDEFSREDFVFSYTRKMALEDGVLVHIPNKFYLYHSAVTIEVLSRIGTERMDALIEASVKAQVKNWETGALFLFEGLLYKIICGPGDEHEPVITIMMSWES